MHDVAVALDEELVGDLDGADLGDAADVVAAEVEQHQVLGALLRIGEQLLLQRLVLVRRRAARPRAGDRADRHRAVAHAHQDLRARAGDREAAEVEEVEERRRIDPAQRAVERERRQRERRLEALRQHHLEDVAGQRCIPWRARTIALVFGGRGVGLRRHVERAGIASAAALSSGRSSASTTADSRSVARVERGLRRDARLRAAPA